MEDFTVTTHLAKNDYIKYMYDELYKKPMFILATLVGLYLIITVILNYLHIINYYSAIPYFEIIFGIFILSGPTLIVLIAAKTNLSNPGLQHEIKYTFGQDGVVVKGLTCESTFKWAHIIKQKETKKFLLLYSSKKSGNFVDKSKLTTDQIKFIKSKIGKR